MVASGPTATTASVTMSSTDVEGRLLRNVVSIGRAHWSECRTNAREADMTRDFANRPRSDLAFNKLNKKSSDPAGKH